MRKNLLKSFVLLASFVLGTVVTWAQTTLYERGVSTSWSASDLAEWSGDYGTLEIADGLKYTSPENGGGVFTKAIATEDNSKITVNAKWYVGGSTGRAGNHNFLKLGNIEIRAYGQDQFGGIYEVGGQDVQLVKFGKKDDVRPSATAAPWDIVVTMDKASGKVSYSITLNSSGLQEGELSLAKVSFDDIAIGFRKGGRTVTSTSKLVSIEVAEEVQVVSIAEYTVNFVGPDGALKASEVRSGVVGNAIPLTQSDKDPIYNEDKSEKFIYADDDADSKTIAADGSTQVNVYFRAAELWDYTVNAYDDADLFLKKLGEGSFFEGESSTTYYPMAFQQDGTWYATTANTSNPHYGVTATAAGEMKVTYTETSDFDYFIECEDMTPSRSWAANGDQPQYYSNGVSVRLLSGAHAYTEPIEEGVYTVSMTGFNNNSSDATLNLYLRDADGNLTDLGLSFEDWAKQSGKGTKTVEGVTIFEGCSLVVMNPSSEYNSNIKMDYITLKRTDVVAKADYTVAFVGPNGEELKPSETREGAVGIDVTLTSDDKLTIVAEDGTKYIYESDDAEGKTIAADGSTVVTVTFREAETYQYTVTSSVGDYQVEGEAIEGETVKVAYPRYVNVDGTLYEKAATNKEYNYSFVVNEDGQEETLDYNPTEISNVIYFAEGEDVEGMTVTSESNIAIRSSNSKAGYPKDKKVVFVWLEPGTYKLFSVVADCAGKTASAVFNYKTDDIEILTHTTANINWDQQEAEFTLDKASRVFVEQGGSSKKAIDFIYIQKLSAEGGVTTGVDGIAEMAEQPAATYTLSGVATRGGNLPKGIYIVGGKKKVVK